MSVVTQTPCVVCGQPGVPVAKAKNGLPAGVVVCRACIEAIGRREVGIVLHVTDGRRIQA